MFYFLLIVALLLFSILILIFIELTFVLDYKKEKEIHELSFNIHKEIFNTKVKLFSVTLGESCIDKIFNKGNASKIKLNNKDQNEQKDINLIEFIEKFGSFYTLHKHEIGNTLNYLKNKLFIDNITLKLYFGLYDAAITGISTGAIWALVSNVLSLINRYFNIKKTDISINPDFNSLILNVNLYGIFKFRFVNIMFVSHKYVKHFFN